MPVWNGETYLREAIDSILNQTFDNFEFLILDDGSTDETPVILNDYVDRDPRIRIIPLDHQGIVMALNLGVKEARANWIARMDCDDIARPERLERQWQAVQKRPDAVLCHTQIHIIGEERYVTPAGRFIRTEAMIRLRLCFHCPIIHPTVMFRSDSFLACGGYLPEERHAEDFGLWGRLVEKGAIVGISKPLLDLRVHHASISKQEANFQMELSRKIALRHCRQFMRLNHEEAELALDSLTFQRSSSSLSNWFWLLSFCLPRLRKHSFELWSWVAYATIRRLIKNMTQ
jgi:glycosyltransferase involved in cell wall biosynthesis